MISLSLLHYILLTFDKEINFCADIESNFSHENERLRGSVKMYTFQQPTASRLLDFLGEKKVRKTTIWLIPSLNGQTGESSYVLYGTRLHTGYSFTCVKYLMHDPVVYGLKVCKAVNIRLSIVVTFKIKYSRQRSGTTKNMLSERGCRKRRKRF